MRYRSLAIAGMVGLAGLGDLIFPVSSKSATLESALRDGWRADFARPTVVYPINNPPSDAKAKLGSALFFDPVLSQSRTFACATCHIPSLAWADNQPLSIGETGASMKLRSPTLLNVGLEERLGWDGKFPTLESVSFRAISGPANMNLPETEALNRLQASPAYVRMFEAVFGDQRVTRARVEQALATFERGIMAGVAPFDRWVAGDETAVSDAAKRGFSLFDGKAGCSGCHSGWAFSDFSFQDIGSATGSDVGRGRMFPSSIALKYAFKVPSLRDVLIRAPYMHNGSKRGLIDVIEHYNQGGIDRPSRSKRIHPLHLTPPEKAEIVAFLATLTSERADFTAPLLPR